MADMYASRGAGNGPRGWRWFSSRGRAATAVLACAVIAGGAFAVTEGLSGGHPGAAATAAGSGPTGQAAVLGDVLSSAVTTAGTPSASAPAAAAGSPARRRAARLRARRMLRLIRRLGGEYGTFTYATRTAHRTLAFERGTVLSVAGNDVTVRAKDGTTWTWVYGSRFAVRESGKRVAPATLASGDPVFVGGLVAGTAHDARVVVIR